MIPVDAADARVNAYMAKSQSPIMVTKIKKGHNHDAELEDIRREISELGLRDLADDVYDAELWKLRAERDRVAALENVPDELVSEPTGETYAERWARLSNLERNAWMLDAGIKIWGMQGDDDEVLYVLAEPRNAGLFWTEDGTEPPPPAVDGAWLYIPPARFKMRLRGRPIAPRAEDRNGATPAG